MVTATTLANAVEGVSDGTIRLTLSAASTQPITVNYTFGGTATPSSDYAANPLAAIFTPGQTTADVTGAPMDDATPEAPETVILNLSSSPDYTIGANGAATLYIIDNDGIALPPPPTPANLTWTDTTGDNQFDNSANWLSSDGQMRIPHAGDSIVFVGGSGSSLPLDCYGMHGDSAGAYNSVELASNYTGRVTLSGGFTTGGLTLASGIIDQPTPVFPYVEAFTYLTVTSNFSWTGGTLNSTTYNSDVYILGNGAIAPNNFGTVTTGSTLHFAGTTTIPTTTAVEPGTVQFNNAAGAVIGNAATVRVDTIATNLAQFKGALVPANTIQIQAGGSFEVRGIGDYSSGSVKFLNSGGLFKLTGQVNATLNGGDLATKDYEPVAKVPVPWGDTALPRMARRFFTPKVWEPSAPCNARGRDRNRLQPERLGHAPPSLSG